MTAFYVISSVLFFRFGRNDMFKDDKLKDHTSRFACLSLIYSVFIHVTLLTIISQRIKPYFSFPDILLNLFIFQNQIFK
ncbi:hypothetical protein LDENG_00188110 [Lucifuga dentata]|nr:hypothetical protein LDENG_00188110 [Lucifuga dentata]